MSLVLKVSPAGGYQSIFSPGEHGIQWLGLGILRLGAGDSWQRELSDEEAALVILSGQCNVSIKDQDVHEWQSLGRRAHIFGGPATAVYAPRTSHLEIAAESELEMAIIQAPCEIDLSPALIEPHEVKTVSSGMANWERQVRMIIPPGSSISQRLIVGETFNPAGNWSGVPPHKHGVINEAENLLEEFYLFKTEPLDGDAVQLLYYQDRREAYIVGNNDVIILQNGYHPTVALPGTTLCYLWALSGQNKNYHINIDPRFAWVQAAEKNSQNNAK